MTAKVSEPCAAPSGTAADAAARPAGSHLPAGRRPAVARIRRLRQRRDRRWPRVTRHARGGVVLAASGETRRPAARHPPGGRQTSLRKHLLDVVGNDVRVRVEEDESITDEPIFQILGQRREVLEHLRRHR